MRRGDPVAHANVRNGIASALLLLAMTFCLPRFALGQHVDVPYVPTPWPVVEAMLKLANVGPADYVIDLGSGDGRILIMAAKKYGARGFGVDLDSGLVYTARREAERQGVREKVEFETRNLFITDISRATVLTTYLFTSVNMQLRPRIFDELKPGARVVSHEFDFGNWKPDAQLTVPVPDKPYGPPSSVVYLWIVPANAAGRWQWTQGAGAERVEHELALEQTFQELRGSARVAGQTARLESVTLRGEDIRVAFSAMRNGRSERVELAGRVAGDRIEGTMRVAGTPDSMPWQARRVAAGKIAYF